MVKYETYVRMNKQHKEEYTFRFENSTFIIMTMLSAIAAGICFLLGNATDTIIMAILASILTMLFLRDYYKEYHWLKERGYS
jgi:hypothetical protein